MLARQVRRDNCLAASFVEPIAQAAGIIGPVCQQAARVRDTRQKLGDAGQVMRLSRCKAERDGASKLIRQGMNLGRSSAARSPDRVGELPLLRRWQTGAP